MSKVRTVEEFVEDMVSDGKSLKQILTIALSTRWKSYKEEIEKVYNKLKFESAKDSLINQNSVKERTKRMAKKKKKKEKKFTGEVTKTRAVKIFEALGFKTASQWKLARLQSKFEKLDTLIEGAKLTAKMQRRINTILRGQSRGVKVVVVDVEDVDAGKKREKDVDDAKKRATSRKEDAKVKKTKKAKKKAAPKKEAAVKDKCGRREGTQGFLINEHISKKAKTPEQLAKETKLPVARIANHLRDMVAKDFVKKTAKGTYCWK